MSRADTASHREYPRDFAELCGTHQSSELAAQPGALCTREFPASFYPADSVRVICPLLVYGSKNSKRRRMAGGIFHTHSLVQETNGLIAIQQSVAEMSLMQINDNSQVS